MRQQTDGRTGELSPSLRAKLESFARGLTADEVNQLRGLPTGDGNGMWSSLWARLEQAADGLTEDDVAELRLLSAATGGGADAEGFMKPLYDDGQGYKGRHRPTEGTGGGGGLVPDFGEELRRRYNAARMLADGVVILFQTFT